MSFPGFDGATGWLNSEPLTAEGLRGRVVLVQFWTYTCINWIRTLPYVRAWAERYRGDGLVVVGVHTPEFPFEHELENIREAAGAMQVDYPIAIDNDYAIWSAFDNHYWPALYLVDGEGRTRHQHFGEGAYEATELIIQRLLAVDGGFVDVDGDGIEAAADWDTLESPETYLGSEQAANRGSPGDLRLNQWAIAGDWTIDPGVVVLNEADGAIEHRFHARDVNLVMGPGLRGSSVRFRVLVDGGAPGSDRGADVDEEGMSVADSKRLYQLVRQRRPIDDRTFRIQFLDPGVEAYAFTFG